MTRISAHAGLGRLLLHHSMAVFLFCAILVSGCSPPKAASDHPKIDAKVQVKVEDPNIKRFTNITSNAQVVASGNFAAGTYFVKNSVVSIPPDTTFQLNLKLDIDDPNVISTAEASGTLTTNNQISFNTIPVPKTIDLNKGTVSGDVDLARSIGAYFFNLIQVGSVSDDLKDMVNTIKIEKLVLNLKPDSTIHLGQKSLHIGPNSKVELVDAVFDNHLNYIGTCKLNINFAKDCKWLGDKVDCLFEGGKIDSQFHAEKFHDRLVLELPENVDPKDNRPVTLNNCTFRFGKNKRSSAIAQTCVGVVKEFSWQLVKGEEHPTLHLVSTMDMTGTNLHLKTDIHQTIGYFPNRVPGKLVANIKKDGRETFFETTGDAQAKTGQIIIEKKTTKVVLTLENVNVGPSSYEKEGSLKFSLAGGVANIRQLDWQAKGHKFSLKCGSGSTLTLPAEMLLEKSTPSTSTKLNLPLQLKLGTATLHTDKNVIELANLDGKILIDVGQEIQLRSDLNFGLQNLTILDGYNAKVIAKGLDLSVIDGKSKVILKKCSILVPDQPLKDAIAKRLPKSLSFKLNKTIKEDKTWRYRNAVAKDVKVTNLEVGGMQSKGPNTLSFTASGDVFLNGTIDKTGLIFNKDEWETKPWNISGHVQGEGTIKYKFSKKKGNDDELLQYDVSMELRVPDTDDVKLDWSKVAGGILKMAEKKSIMGRLKKVDIPLHHEGEIDLIEKEAPAWKNLSVSNVSVKDAPNGGTLIDFSAETGSVTTSAKSSAATKSKDAVVQKSTRKSG